MTVPDQPPLPRATWWPHAYNTINTVCWGIVTGVPMQLLLKDLGATATVIGVLLALPSGMNLIQLWIAPAIDRQGYKRFALFGWVWRVAAVFALVVLALGRDVFLGWGVPAGALVALALVLQVVFNLLRIAANTAFMPWYTALIPEQQRGRFLARENIAGNIGGILSAVICWALFTWNPPGVYGLMFALAALAGVVAVSFIQRIPDVPKPATVEAADRQPLRAVLTPPFVAQLVFNLLWTLAMSASGVCWVGVLRDVGQAPPSMPALLPMVGAWTALALLPIVGPVVDHTGNRPALGVGCLLATAHLILWGLLAIGVLPFGWGSLILIQTCAACGGSLFALAAARLLMSVVPSDLRAQGFALHGVVCGISGAVFPIGWGMLFDLLTHHGLSHGQGYGTLYGLASLCGMGAVILARRLPDPGAHRMRDFLRIVGQDVWAVLSRRPAASRQ